MENEKKATAANKQDEKKVLTVGVGAPLRKTETAKKIKLKPKTKVLTLEDKLVKVQKMKDLVDKRTKLNYAISKLDSICLSDDELETKLTITDGKRYEGKEFNTTNTLIIDEVAELLKEEIFKNIEKVEAELNKLV